MEYKFTKIEKHPLKNSFVVYWTFFTCVPPYFGTKDQCIKAQKHMEAKAIEEFNKLSLKEQKEVKFLNK